MVSRGRRRFIIAGWIVCWQRGGGVPGGWLVASGWPDEKGCIPSGGMVGSLGSARRGGGAGDLDGDVEGENGLMPSLYGPLSG